MADMRIIRPSPPVSEWKAEIICEHCLAKLEVLFSDLYLRSDCSNCTFDGIDGCECIGHRCINLVISFRCMNCNRENRNMILPAIIRENVTQKKGD